MVGVFGVSSISIAGTSGYFLPETFVDIASTFAAKPQDGHKT